MTRKGNGAGWSGKVQPNQPDTPSILTLNSSWNLLKTTVYLGLGREFLSKETSARGK